MNGGRIAVTGVGLVSGLGSDAKSTFDGLVRGERAFSEISLFETLGQRVSFAAEVRGFRAEDVTPRGASWSRSDALALAAAREALGNARRPGLSIRLGIAVGVTTAGMFEAEELLGVSHLDPTAATAVKQLISYPISSTVARLVEALAPVERSATICSACSSGACAIIEGAAWLRAGAVDAVLAGGTDALCRLTLTGFNALGATDLTPCRPFDRARAGLTLGEGAGFLLLETEHSVMNRGATVIAWLTGCAVGAEAHHITQPEPSGRGPAALLGTALERACTPATEVDYINAHGTGTRSNDMVEARAIQHAFGGHAMRVLVSSSKGQLGHTLGAAGAIEAGITVLALARQIAPPTGGLVEADEACRLHHVIGEGRPARLRVAVSNVFGFGGSGAVLVFEQADAAPRTAAGHELHELVITGASNICRSGVVLGKNCAFALEAASEPPPLRLPFLPLELLDPRRSRRFDRHAALVVAGASAALSTAALSADGVGLVTGSAFGAVERTVTFLRTVAEKGPRRAAPAEFPHLVPSAASGNASIYLGLTGPILSTSSIGASAEAAIALACDLVATGQARGIVAGGAESYDSLVDSVLSSICESTGTGPRSEGSSFVIVESRSAAEKRGASVLAAVRRKYEIPTGSVNEAAFEPPRSFARALIVTAREPDWLASLFERSGWGRAEIRNVASTSGWHDGVGGSTIAAAAASIASDLANEVLVVGWDHVRVFAFHLEKER